ncbi:hypothetical protein [Tabrizicola sp. BL-A-41-H6]|uniref:hypothetical protein n=1 Tax=Tabrizicola sp. BL-A-41-H6 TaxID=3421107 RepID=UPI003D67188A
MARAFTVTGRQDGQVFMPDMVGALQLGAAVDVSPEVVLTEPGWTLFSFDLAASEAVFVDVGPCDLSQAPFSYQRQFEIAQRVLRLPFADVLGMADAIPAAPQVHLFNIGHCGSTLLHNVFNQTEVAWCLSEPLFVFDLAMGRDKVVDEVRVALLRAGCAFMRLFPGYAGQVQVLKHFSQALMIAEDCQRATPDARFLFLYRDAESWCNSVYGFVQRMGGQMQVPKDEREFVWWIMSGNMTLGAAAGLVDMTGDVLMFDELSAAVWILQRDRFHQVVAAGVPMRATPYEALVADRERTLAGIFAECGLPDADMEGALTAFDSDSHAGTATARSVPVERLDEAALARVRGMLAGLRPPLTGAEPWLDAG